MGAKTMIYFFHYANKGELPFTPGVAYAAQYRPGAIER
jgi:hypothetical protein